MSLSLTKQNLYKNKQLQTMKKTLTIAVIGLLQSFSTLEAQVSSGPYLVKNSEIFTSPKGHKVLSPLGYGNNGIIQVNGQGVESFNFQKFSKDLKLEKENTVSIKDRIPDHNYYERFIVTKNKTYLLTRDVKKDVKTEGISALEFYPDKLDFASKSVELFQSTDRVQSLRKPGVMEVPGFGIGGLKMYDFTLSEDKTKFLYDYKLVAAEKKDKINKDVIGLYVFDENLTKLWGGEYKMPYTEAIMDNLGYTLSDDGKVYLLAKVFDNDDRKAKTKDGKAGYHFEVLIYDKDRKGTSPIVITLDNYFSQDAFVYEDMNHNMIVAGFYGKKPGAFDEGAYMVKLDVANSTVSKLNGGYYEISSDLIKAFSSEREKKVLAKKEGKDGDIGIPYLRIRDVVTTPNGSTKIIAEQYEQKMTSNFISASSNGLSAPSLGVGIGVMAAATNSKVSYETFAGDIYVFSIDPTGKLEWTKKIPKNQHSADWLGVSISMNNLTVGNDIHLFFLDNVKNMNLKPSEAPKRHEDRRGGFLNGVTVDANGTVTKYNLGDTKEYKTNFFLRYFVKNQNKALISTMRKKKKNLLMSIEVK